MAARRVHKWKTPYRYPLSIELPNVDGPDEPIVLERFDAALVGSVERKVGPERVENASTKVLY